MIEHINSVFLELLQNYRRLPKKYKIPNTKHFTKQNCDSTTKLEVFATFAKMSKASRRNAWYVLLLELRITGYLCLGIDILQRTVATQSSSSVGKAADFALTAKMAMQILSGLNKRNRRHMTFFLLCFWGYFSG